MATSNETPEPSLPHDLAERFGVLAPVKLAAIAHHIKLEAAKIRTLKLKHARMVARYGARSAEVAELEHMFDARVAAMAALRSDGTTALHAASARAKGALIVHGHVVDHEGKGSAGATVIALDPQHKAIATAGTDAAGAFVLEINPETAPTITLRFTVPHGKSTDIPDPIEVHAGRVEAVELRSA